MDVCVEDTLFNPSRYVITLIKEKQNDTTKLPFKVSLSKSFLLLVSWRLLLPSYREGIPFLDVLIDFQLFRFCKECNLSDLQETLEIFLSII